MLNFELKVYPYRQRPVNIVSEWEHKVLDFISKTRAASYSQLIDTNVSLSRQHKLHRKLDALGRCGLLRKYQLINPTQEINICASVPFEEPEDLFKSISFTQFIRLTNAEIIHYDNSLLCSEIKFANNVFTIAVLTNSAMIPLINSYSKIIILSDEFHDDFKYITVPARIMLTVDLFSNNRRFYLPNKTEELF